MHIPSKSSLTKSVCGAMAGWDPLFKNYRDSYLRAFAKPAPPKTSPSGVEKLREEITKREEWTASKPRPTLAKSTRMNQKKGTKPPAYLKEACGTVRSKPNEATSNPASINVNHLRPPSFFGESGGEYTSPHKRHYSNRVNVGNFVEDRAAKAHLYRAESPLATGRFKTLKEDKNKEAFSSWWDGKHKSNLVQLQERQEKPQLKVDSCVGTAPYRPHTSVAATSYAKPASRLEFQVHNPSESAREKILASTRSDHKPPKEVFEAYTEKWFGPAAKSWERSWRTEYNTTIGSRPSTASVP